VIFLSLSKQEHQTNDQAEHFTGYHGIPYAIQSSDQRHRQNRYHRQNNGSENREQGYNLKVFTLRSTFYAALYLCFGICAHEDIERLIVLQDHIRIATDNDAILAQRSDLFDQLFLLDEKIDLG